MRIKLIATDMDGTLLDSEKKMPDDFFEWVNEHDKVKFVIASGRQYYALKRDFVPIHDKLIYIAENGAIIFHHDEIIYYESLNDNLIQIKQTFFDNALKADQLARSGEADFKVCYLTFDDGPYLLTDTILDILEEKDVLATFFARKRLDEDYIPIYLRERVNGHTIGNHTASHKISKGIYRSNEIFINDIIENRQFIFDMLGVTTDVMRFPGGSYEATYMGLSKSKLVNELNDIGYGYVDWTHATGDGGATLSPYEYLHNVIDYTDDDRAIVVLMHDYSKNTAECLPEMIDELSKQGYIFLPLWHDSPAVKKGA